MNQNPLFNYDVEIDPMTIDIRSETLEPISTSTRRVVFRLDAAGNLDQNSVLLFKVAASGSAADNQLRANEMFGGLLAIKRATLQVGDHILNDTSDIGRIAAMTSMASLNEATRNQLLGHYYQNQFHSKVLTSYDVTESRSGGVGSIVVDKERSGTNFGDVSTNASASVNSCNIKTDASLNRQFGIPLGTILPCLKNRSLPLFLFQEYRILITIEFHDAPEWINNITNTSVVVPESTNALNNGMVASAGQIVYSDIKLQVDYLIMPSEIQAQSRNQINQQGGLRLDFYDIIKVEKNVPAATPNAKQIVEMRIGADNKEVHKIYMIKRLDRNNRGIGKTGLTLNRTADGTADKTDGAVAEATTSCVGKGEGMTVQYTVAGGAIPVFGTAAGNTKVVKSGKNYAVGDVVTINSTGAVDTKFTVTAVGTLNRPVIEDKILCGARCDGMNQEEYNVNIDGADVFPEDKWSVASQYDEVSNCLGKDLELVRPFYFCDENTIVSRLADPEDGILGKYKPLCLDLTNGEPVIVGGGRNIGAYPIIWKYARKPLPLFQNPAATANGGVGNLWNGCDASMEVDFFMLVSRVANVRSTPQGTAVSVSY